MSKLTLADLNDKQRELMTISFFVPGKPKPAGSKRAFIIKSKNSGKARAIVTDANPNSRDWKIDVQYAARSVHTGPPIVGAVDVCMTFLMERPRSHYRSGKHAHLLREDAPLWPTSKPDLLKLARGVEDALSGMLYGDDAQMVNEELMKRYVFRPRGEEPGVKVVIAPHDAQALSRAVDAEIEPRPAL